jgi:tripartite-type tricarboxylate transporter receptor subunit TctC
VNWYGILVAAKTPAPVIARLNEGWLKTLGDPAMREKMNARGAEPVGNSPEEFGSYLRDDMARWAKVAQSTGIKVD